MGGFLFGTVVGTIIGAYVAQNYEVNSIPACYLDTQYKAAVLCACGQV
jgi:hypothetical protein